MNRAYSIVGFVIVWSFIALVVVWAVAEVAWRIRVRVVRRREARSVVKEAEEIVALRRIQER